MHWTSLNVPRWGSAPTFSVADQRSGEFKRTKMHGQAGIRNGTPLTTRFIKLTMQLVHPPQNKYSLYMRQTFRKYSIYKYKNRQYRSWFVVTHSGFSTLPTNLFTPKHTQHTQHTHTHFLWCLPLVRSCGDHLILSYLLTESTTSVWDDSNYLRGTY